MAGLLRLSYWAWKFGLYGNMKQLRMHGKRMQDNEGDELAVQVHEGTSVHFILRTVCASLNSTYWDVFEDSGATLSLGLAMQQTLHMCAWQSSESQPATKF